ncbi:hypothetical protein SLEP1_g11747 [Rubroshorea leprosula]|nr:hypothetical protein SLEP1_g11747 [Rubroshorea leprosula]
MEVAASCLNGNFGANHSSDEVLSRWRKACSVVKNIRRRFRVTVDFSKRSKASAMLQANLLV